MSLRFLLDENQRGLLWRAIQRHNRSGGFVLDVERVGDPDDLPLGATDAEVLAWAERERRILLTFVSGKDPPSKIGAPMNRVVKLSEVLRAHIPTDYVLSNEQKLNDDL